MAKQIHILVGISGSIAACKTPMLVRQLKQKGWAVSCLMTKSAEEFVSKMVLSTFCEEPVPSDMFGPEAYKIPHIKMAEKTDVYVLVAVTATVMARCANGMGDDLVSLTYLATKKPVIMVPAMHDSMWEHPATQANVETLKKRGVTFVGPVQGKLADATEGPGRMAEIEDIVLAVEKV